MHIHRLLRLLLNKQQLLLAKNIIFMMLTWIDIASSLTSRSGCNVWKKKHRRCHESLSLARLVS